MQSPADRITELIIHHLEGRITGSENQELQDWMDQSPMNRESVASFLNEEKLQAGIRDMYHYRQKIWNTLQQQLNTAKITPMRRSVWWRYAAAAVLVAIISGTAYFIFNKNNREADLTSMEKRFKNDVQPAGEQTVLILGDGRQLVLDSVSGAISKQGTTTVINLGGELRYKASSHEEAEVVYNTIHTGKGNRYNLILPDGSKVFLNAASSLRFPTTFPGSERMVELTGEGYFEIAHNKAKPFHVHYANMDVEVLGTHFNINTYEDEPILRTTLLEGSVKVTRGGLPRLLKPGEQLSVTRAGEVTLLKGVNLDEIIAWKENRFEFSDAPIEAVMRELSRWYDIMIIYEGKVSQGFNGRISRNEPISKVLKLLQLTEQVRFKIEGKTVTVMK